MENAIPRALSPVITNEPIRESSAPFARESSVIHVSEDRAPTNEVALSTLGAILNPSSFCDVLENRCVYVIRVVSPIVAIVTAVALIALGGTQQTNPYFSFASVLFVQAMFCFVLAHRVLILKTMLKLNQSMTANVELERQNAEKLKLELEQQANDYQEGKKAFIEKIQGLEQQKLNLELKITNLQREINNLNAQIKEFVDQIGKMREENEKLANTAITMTTTAGEQKKLVEFQQQLEKKHQALLDLQTKLVDKEQELLGKEQELAEKRKKAEATHEALIDAQRNIFELSKDRELDRRIVQMLQQSHADLFSKIVKAIEKDDLERSPQRKSDVK